MGDPAPALRIVKCDCNLFHETASRPALTVRNVASGLGLKVWTNANNGVSATTDQGYAAVMGAYLGIKRRASQVQAQELVDPESSESNGVFGLTVAANGSGVFGFNTFVDDARVHLKRSYDEVLSAVHSAGVSGISAAGTGVVGIGLADRGVYASGVIGVHAVAVDATTRGGEFSSVARGKAGVFEGGVDVRGKVEIWAPSAATSANAPHPTFDLPSATTGFENFGSPGLPGSGGFGSTAPSPWNWAAPDLGLVVHGIVQVDVIVADAVYKNTNQFLIDHPDDPENRLLAHSVIEGPEMTNLYDGVVEIDEVGEAVVYMPAYFAALNTKLRYQLTSIGAPAPLVHIKQEFADGCFIIAGAVPGSKVSWQVTGVRNDPWAVANPLVVEQDKPDHQRGLYRNPEVYGQPASKGIFFRRDAAREVDPVREASASTTAGPS